MNCVFISLKMYNTTKKLTFTKTIILLKYNTGNLNTAR